MISDESDSPPRRGDVSGIGLYLEGITTSTEPNLRSLGSLSHIQQQSLRNIVWTIIVCSL